MLASTTKNYVQTLDEHQIRLLCGIEPEERIKTVMVYRQNRVQGTFRLSVTTIQDGPGIQLAREDELGRYTDPILRNEEGEVHDPGV